MKTFPLDDFILTGEIFGIKNENTFDEVNKKHKLILSVYEDESGNNEMCDLVKSNIRIRLGFKDKKVIYIMINMHRYINSEVRFTLGKIDLKKAELSDILKYLNNRDIQWKFKTAVDKVVVVSMGINYPTEFIYSMETGEEEIYSIQTTLMR